MGGFMRYDKRGGIFVGRLGGREVTGNGMLGN